MSKPARRKKQRHVTRAERRMIRRQESRFPALGSAIKTLLEIHALEARAIRNASGNPYCWVAERAGPHKKAVFEMRTNATLEDWQERVSQPDTWNGMTFMGMEYNPNKWLETHHQQMNRISGVMHDEVIIDEVSTFNYAAIEARLAAHGVKAGAPQPMGTARTVRKKSWP